jgi:hypothetical protein
MNKMNKKGATIGLLIMIFIGVIVGIALFSASADQVAIGTTKATATDETTNLTTSCYTAGGLVNESNANCNITVTNAPTGWKVTDCPLESVVVTNATGTALTLSTDYNLFASTGVVQMLNTAATNTTNLGENVLIDYSYCRDGYNKDSSSRTILNIILIFLAIAIMAIVIPGFRDVVDNFK